MRASRAKRSRALVPHAVFLKRRPDSTLATRSSVPRSQLPQCHPRNLQSVRRGSVIPRFSCPVVDFFEGLAP